ncbi:MAG: hypothetical protein J5860_05475 [Clostridia bacterium]|nr:hypothetical protein [Clostridia bacterium]MBO4429596.1 hypothetical protein [Clostridia bacterium]
MSTGEIISIITVAVSFIIGVSGLIVNTFIQRKNNSIRVITEKRLERRTITQNIFGKILCYSDPDFLKCLNEEEKKENLKLLTEAVSMLRSMYEFSFEADAKMIEKAYSIKEIVSLFENNDEALLEKIKEARKNFSELVDVYVSTEWTRIKNETVGIKKKTKKKAESWDYIHLNYSKKFNTEVNKNIYLK